MEIENPFTHRVIGEVEGFSPEKIKESISSARQGAEISGKLFAHRRADILYRTSQLLYPFLNYGIYHSFEVS
ncbi:MAG: hypothetical protein U9R36_03075 [Elusimicrobiota bacterium]|nr:hypothetical protein [Elusimicrobiota bacterium]